MREIVCGRNNTILSVWQKVICFASENMGMPFFKGHVLFLSSFRIKTLNRECWQLLCVLALEEPKPIRCHPPPPPLDTLETSRSSWALSSPFLHVKQTLENKGQHCIFKREGSLQFKNWHSQQERCKYTDISTSVKTIRNLLSYQSQIRDNSTQDLWQLKQPRKPTIKLCWAFTVVAVEISNLFKITNQILWHIVFQEVVYSLWHSVCAQRIFRAILSLGGKKPAKILKAVLKSMEK